MIKFEICCNSYYSAYNAQQAGADRIELCANLSEGGTTPSYGTIECIKQKLNIPINVLIRPRNGDFLYNKFEIEEIFADIEICKKLDVNGIVCGFLNSDGTINTALTQKAVEASYPLSFTFHRAFDLVKDPYKSLEDIISCGALRLLTSGHKKQAWEGRHLIRELIEIANDKIIIMPGSGINETNINDLQLYTKAQEFHFSGSSIFNSKMEYKKKNILSTETSDFSWSYSDITKIQKTITKLNNI